MDKVHTDRPLLKWETLNTSQMQITHGTEAVFRDNPRIWTTGVS
jgi:hypothetical protein